MDCGVRKLCADSCQVINWSHVRKAKINVIQILNGRARVRCTTERCLTPYKPIQPGLKRTPRCKAFGIHYLAPSMHSVRWSDLRLNRGTFVSNKIYNFDFEMRLQFASVAPSNMMQIESQSTIRCCSMADTLCASHRARSVAWMCAHTARRKKWVTSSC